MLERAMLVIVWPWNDLIEQREKRRRIYVADEKKRRFNGKHDDVYEVTGNGLTSSCRWLIKSIALGEIGIICLAIVHGELSGRYDRAVSDRNQLPDLTYEEISGAAARRKGETNSGTNEWFNKGSTGVGRWTEFDFERNRWIIIP